MLFNFYILYTLLCQYKILSFPFHYCYIYNIMKFGRILMMLMTLIEETLPDWRDKFLSYKDLKKQLKLIYANNNKRRRLEPDDGIIYRNEVNEFVKLLEKEIDKFNTFFLEKEEDYIIQLRVLIDGIDEIRTPEELIRVGRDLVDLHGQMVLLENYSSLNYTGLLKILKKYDKRTGALIRFPVIQKVLEEPFFKTDVLNKLVKECETMLSSLLSQNEPSNTPGGKSNGEGSSREGIGGSDIRVNDAEEVAEIEKTSKAPEGEGSSRGGDSEEGNYVAKDPDEELAEIGKLSIAPGAEGSRGDVEDPEEELAELENMGNMYLKLTKSALRVLKEIRSGSSTVSIFSLPPLENDELHA